MRNADRSLHLVGGALLALAAVHACARGFELDSSPLHHSDATAGADGAPAITGQPARPRAIRAYDSIAIGTPENDTTVFDNRGNVEVTVAVSPALRADAGDRIALICDGRQISEGSATHIELSNITRGEHSLEAQVVDNGGNTLISSNPVKFQLWQASRLFPNRRGK